MECGEVLRTRVVGVGVTVSEVVDEDEDDVKAEDPDEAEDEIDDVDEPDDESDDEEERGGDTEIVRLT